MKGKFVGSGRKKPDQGLKPSCHYSASSYPIAAKITFLTVTVVLTLF